VKVPVTLTGPAPVKPEYGEIVSATAAPFVKVAVALSLKPACPATLIVYTPLASVFVTVKDPATVPSLAR